ncbi:MAG: dihydroneopterin aldolase [Candidatus Rokubacteria bacterium]|nr:dihydroneopterin aldolase [Candidatus Rokubacteria bacterium]
MADTIFLENVRFFGHHGVTKAQQSVGAWFAVDVALSLDLTPAALSDDLAATVDYGLVARRIVEISTKERVNLLERLAGLLADALVARRIVEISTKERVNLLERLAGLLADALLREFPAREVRLRVRKLTPPMEGFHGTPGVEITRRR